MWKFRKKARPHGRRPRPHIEIPPPKAPITIDLRGADQSGPPAVDSMTLLRNFDPIRIGDEVAALESEAQAAKGVFDDRSAKIAAILWNIKQHHPEHLKAVCERAGIGRSRRKQLLQIGSGSKTLEKSRAENKTRVQRHRAKARAITVMAPLAATRAEPHKPDNNTDPDESAAKADHAANEGNGARAVRANDKPLAKSEFAYACDHWLPLMSRHDQVEALRYAKDVVDRSCIPAENENVGPGRADTDDAEPDPEPETEKAVDTSNLADAAAHAADAVDNEVPTSSLADAVDVAHAAADAVDEEVPNGELVDKTTMLVGGVLIEDRCIPVYRRRRWSCKRHKLGNLERPENLVQPDLYEIDRRYDGDAGKVCEAAITEGLEQIERTVPSTP
jgi:hypothetical protein